MLEPVAALEGHDDRVWDVAWNAERNLLASCGADKTIRIVAFSSSSARDFQNVERIATGHRRTVRSIAWTPNGRTLAAASFDSTISVWEYSADEKLWECSATLEGHETEVKRVAFNRDGTLLATCGRDKSVWVWEVHEDADFECLSVQMEHSQDVKAVAWHPTHDVLASASYDDSIRLYLDDPADDWYSFTTLTEHQSTVWDIAFSPCGRFLASVSDDLTIRIWRTDDRNLRVWTCVTVLSDAHSRPIYSIAWTKGPDWDPHAGRRGRIASAAGDGRVNVWDVTWQDSDENKAPPETLLIARLEEAHGVCDVNTVRWCPRPGAEDLLATAGDDGAVRVWKLTKRIRDEGPR
ncbi:WD40 repeat-like protein [Auricularia subglabra TFB-10046 SS5]|uniref:Probable cytosolic iron-sulfur protein assembly protein 1 n=1 Tax=Auricularia subglabra (strain TFB-10046 / SS5) TaxID=717982 RepID=J0WSP4_AURST|nr:WD40 repeat-like protein [Auricularia subglabra TFB-10046 SS5]